MGWRGSTPESGGYTPHMARVSHAPAATQREPVRSSSIASIGYDAGTKTLQVEFNSGRVYQYYGVPKAVHSDLVGAPSIGAYSNANIRPNYPYARL